MRALTRVLSGVVVFQFGAAAVAWGCSCVPTTAEDAVTSGDAIVVANIKSVGLGFVGCSPSPVTAVVEVTEVIAGEATTGTLKVHTGMGGGDCGLNLKAGQQWVLQVFGDDATVSLCSASAPITGENDAWVAELRAAAAD